MSERTNLVWFAAVARDLAIVFAAIVFAIDVL